MASVALALLMALGAIKRVPTEEPVVALTFDACATRKRAYKFDRAVYEILKAERVPATVFVSGRWLQAHPDAARELAGDELVELGNHSWDHPHMSRLPRSRIASEIDLTEEAIARLGKHSVAFRPPFGDCSPRVVEIAAQRHLLTVTWDVVSGDPTARRAASIVRAVVPRARPGSIVVFHINGRKRMKTALALPTILQELRAKGLRFVLLSELLRLRTRPEGMAHATDPPG